MATATTYPSDPPLECDVVMKGGITSGVVYPRAVCELARTYRLRSVGGSSAGAIAAAAAAAAEVGRARGGFELLDALPDELTRTVGPGRGSVLLHLFQPTRATAGLHRVLVGGTRPVDAPPAGTAAPVAARPRRARRRRALLVVPHAVGRAWSLARAAARGYLGWMLVGAVPGVAATALAWTAGGAARWSGVVAGVLLVVVGAAVAVLLGVVRSVGAMTAQGYGICTGMPGVDHGDAPALTPWLAQTLQRLAGRADDGPPLTFGDLRDHGVDLRMMTTNVTEHRPTTMPWSGQDLYLDRSVWAGLFPPVVLDWLVAHPPAGLDPLTVAAAADAGLVPLPAGDDLPVVVATRMSLSFPGLITAVPLVHVDRRDDGDDAGHDAALRRTTVWFTDGGVCANLPVHFFDSPLATRPTFAIDLRPFPEGRDRSADERENTSLPTTWGERTRLPFHRLPTHGLAGMGAFLVQVVETARGWVDEGQLVMPGNRDRVVTVFQGEDEGGMNLAMPPATVTSLAERGRAGAARLVERFGGDDPGVVPAPGWQVHRWVRLRTATAGFAQWSATFAHQFRAHAAGATPFDAWGDPDRDPPVPDLERDQRLDLLRRTRGLLDVADAWADARVTDSAPRPRSRLRLVPDDASAASTAPSPAAGAAPAATGSEAATPLA